MAQKTISQLNAIPDANINKDCFIPIDNGTQTYKVSFSQLFDAIQGGATQSRDVTGSTTITNDDTMIGYNTASGVIGQTLPLPANMRIGKVLILKNLGVVGNDLTITGTIDGQSSIILAGNADINETVRLKNTGTKWQIIA